VRYAWCKSTVSNTLEHHAAFEQHMLFFLTSVLGMSLLLSKVGLDARLVAVLITKLPSGWALKETPALYSWSSFNFCLKLALRAKKPLSKHKPGSVGISWVSRVRTDSNSSTMYFCIAQCLDLNLDSLQRPLASPMRIQLLWQPIKRQPPKSICGSHSHNARKLTRRLSVFQKSVCGYQVCSY